MALAWKSIYENFVTWLTIVQNSVLCSYPRQIEKPCRTQQDSRSEMETKIPTSEEEIDFSTGHYSDITVLEYELRNHPHKTFVNYLCDGLRYGFDTKISRTDFPTLECRNTVSARSQCKIVGDLLKRNVKMALCTDLSIHHRSITTV